MTMGTERLRSTLARSPGTRRWRRTGIVLFALLPVLASCGTMGTRDPGRVHHDVPTAPFGWPLYEAVCVDWWRLGGNGEDCLASALHPFFVPFYVLSIPVDLVVDTALLPLDIACGLLGYSRASPRTPVRE
jgi:uncharacterized protein YceK